MKKALFTLMCVLGLASCAQAQKQNEEKAAKTLVTFFSATGTTKAVAEKMAKAGGEAPPKDEAPSDTTPVG